MGRYFGTDGFRGKANEELTASMPMKSDAFWDGTMDAMSGRAL